MLGKMVTIATNVENRHSNQRRESRSHDFQTLLHPTHALPPPIALPPLRARSPCHVPIQGPPATAARTYTYTCTMYTNHIPCILCILCIPCMPCIDTTRRFDPPVGYICNPNVTGDAGAGGGDTSQAVFTAWTNGWFTSHFDVKSWDSASKRIVFGNQGGNQGGRGWHFDLSQENRNPADIELCTGDVRASDCGG